MRNYAILHVLFENTKATAILGALRSGVIDIIATSVSNARTVLSLQQNRN
nr:sugar-binding domain-containing protein [Gilliamella apicola]